MWLYVHTFNRYPLLFSYRFAANQEKNTISSTYFTSPIMHSSRLAAVHNYRSHLSLTKVVSRLAAHRSNFPKRDSAMDPTKRQLPAFRPPQRRSKHLDGIVDVTPEIVSDKADILPTAWATWTRSPSETLAS